MATSYTLPAVVYTGNNSTVTPYTIPFPFLESEYVFAAVTSGGVTTELDPADITVTQDEDEQGGTLVTASAVAVTDTITIFRRTDRIQPLEFPANGAFPAESHERALDRLTHITQELNNAVLDLQGDPEYIQVPADGGERDLEDTRYFISEASRTAATPDRIGQLSVTQLNPVLKFGHSVVAGAWTNIRLKVPLYHHTGTSITLAFGDNQMDYLELSGDTTFTNSSLTAGDELVLVLKGDSVLRNLTWPAGMNWEGGSAPTTVDANEWLTVVFNASNSSSNTGVYARFFRSDGGATSVSLTYLTTSSTSFAIGTGSKAFTVDADLDYVAGDWVSIVSRADPTVDYMIGQVTAYTGTTLTVTVSITGGSGTKTDWDINLAGRPGEAGSAGASADNSILALIEAPTAKTYTLCQYATTGGTIANLIAKLSSGTCTVAVKINGTDVTGLAAVAVTSAESTTAATAANTIAVGDTITAVVSSVSSPADLALVVEIS
jgi:hypothetical protein